MPIFNAKHPNVDSANPFDTLILGAGISGLALAWRLRCEERGSLAIVEASDRVGGWIESRQHNDFLFEMGPRSCRAEGPGQATLELARQVGLAEEIIWADASAKSRYLLEGGRLRPLPASLPGLLSKKTTRGLFKALWRERNRPVGMSEDESIAEFATRRFGKRIAHRFFDPMTAGIYAGSIDQLSMRSCFPKLYQWEKEYGSVVRGALSKRKRPKGESGLFSFRSGMETLPRALAQRVDAPIFTRSPVTRLQFYNDYIEVVTPHQKLQCKRLLSTLPAHALIPLLAPHDSSLEELLETIPALSLHVVTMGFRGCHMRHRGFGYLIAREQREPILGCVWDSCIFPQQNHREGDLRLTMMIHADEEEPAEAARDAVQRHMGLHTEPDALMVHRAEKAIPQYIVGHEARMWKLEALVRHRFPRLALLGNSFRGVSVNECVAKAWDVSLPAIDPQRHNLTA